MATTMGTAADNTWTLGGKWSGTLDGLGGVDTLKFGPTLRSAYTIVKNSDGSVSVDSISGASPVHGVLYNMELLVFNDGRDTLDLRTYFPSTSVNHAPTGTVSISGTPSQGNVLTASNTLADADGLGTISYQWLANGASISGATGSSLTVGAAQAGMTISVSASYVDALGNAESVASSATGPVGIFTGGSGNDTLSGGAGNDSLDGSTGTDTALYAGARGTYAVTHNANGSYSVSGGGAGSDTLVNIEKIQFADKTVNLSVQANAASIPLASLNSLVELYTAYFNRVPDADGLSYWIDQFKGGTSLNGVGDAFYGAAISPDFSALTGYSSSMSNADFVIKIYKNVLGQTVTAADSGVVYWAQNLAAGVGRGSVVNQIIVAAHTYKTDPVYHSVADLLDNKLAVGKTFAISDGLTYNSAADSITQGMAIAAAVTATDTSFAIGLIGVSDAPLTA